MYTILRLNKVQTRVITLGDPLNCSSEVIVVITGGPGIPEFYKEFAEQLYRTTQKPVCIIGHAGHDVFENQNETNDLKESWSLYNCDGQIQHKLDLINNYIDKRAKLHLIGHSIGGWLLMELLHKNDYLQKRILSVNLLFPTLQKIASTKNGKLVNNLVRYLHRIILLILFIMQLFPTITILGVKLFLFLNSLPPYYEKRIMIYLNPVLQEKAMLLAYESMERVHELNVQAIKKVQHMANVLYSTDDRWVPMHHIRDLQKFTPQIAFHEVNVEHAFVLKSSVYVATIVGNLIVKDNLCYKKLGLINENVDFCDYETSYTKDRK
ncbi:lipid droplet-associated hydrolase-like [Spodoptera frugiperda]|uniref:Lipid droplet-associated hydrolase n=1 Tax=Spodoptera frugiperda TaxID=7108 RepID=A0A9R0DDV4_SPOFR|nr:lipid droplet-associated hydrolase-like [Spodoptera frugiperda]